MNVICRVLQRVDVQGRLSGGKGNRARAAGKRARIGKVSKEVTAERDALRREAEEDQERSQLPVLRGSEKQTPWALTVRFNLMRDAYSELVEFGQIDENEFESAYLEPARRIDRAGWWIDNKDASVTELRELLADPGEEGIENENPL